MKNIIVICLALATSLAASAQSSNQIDKIYQRYSSGEGIIAFSLNKEMIDAVDLDFDWKEHLRHLEGDIYQLKIISFSKKSNPPQKMASLSRELKKAGMKVIELPEDVKGDSIEGEIQIFAHRQEQYYDQIYLMLLSDNGNDAVVVAINGKLTLSKA